MAIAPPPSRPVSMDDVEALIREARARGRRRRIAAAAIVALAAGVSLALWAAMGGGSTVRVRGHGPIRVVAGHAPATTNLRTRGIGDVGSSGGVTWAINGHGIWLTTDGGRTWRRSVPHDVAAARIAVASPPEIQFVNKKDGWMSAPLAFDRPELSKGAPRWEVDWTRDGGRTWHVSIPPGCLTVCENGSISFLDARHGYAIAETVDGRSPNKLFRTGDGGRTWRLVSQPDVYGRITFVDGLHGFAFGGNPQMFIGPFRGPPLGYLYETADGGLTWSRYDPAGTGSFVERPYGAGGREIVAVENGPNRDGGLNLAPATVYASPDAGRHWSGRAVPFGPTVGVSFSAASPGVWAWATQRDLFVTARAGNGWRKVVLRGMPRNGSIVTIAFTSSSAGWAVLDGYGSHPDLFRTTDGGLHWKAAGPRLPRQSSGRGA